MNGDMITINSDKIVINAKGSFGDTHISAVRSVNLSAIDSINLEVPEAGGVITLGSPDANNPVVKGLELLVLFKDLFNPHCSLEYIERVVCLMCTNPLEFHFIPISNLL